MGKAAYDRGSRCVSESIYGADLRPDIQPAPRPPSWGSKVQALAEAKATGVLRYLRSKGSPDPSVEDLADMTRMETQWGVEVCAHAAKKALK